MQFNKNGLLAVANESSLYIFNIKQILPNSEYKQNEETI